MIVSLTEAKSSNITSRYGWATVYLHLDPYTLQINYYLTGHHHTSILNIWNEDEQYLAMHNGVLQVLCSVRDTSR